MEGGVPEEVAVSEAEKTKLPEGVKKLRDASEQADKAGAKGTLAAATGEPAGMLKFLKQKLPMTGEEALEEIKAIDERRAKELALPKVTEEEHLKNLALGEELLFQQMQRGAAGEESPLTKRLNLAREARLKKEQLEQQRSEQLEREATPEYKAMKKEEREREALIHELEEQKKDTNLAHLRAAREAAIEVLGKEGARKLEDVGEEAKPHLEAEKQRNPEVSTLIWEVSDSPGAEYKSAATVRAMKAVIAETVVDAYGRLHSELKKAGAKSKEGAKMMAELEDRLFPSIFKRTEGEERREIRLQVMELAKNATRADETPVTELVDDNSLGVSTVNATESDLVTISQMARQGMNSVGVEKGLQKKGETPKERALEEIKLDQIELQQLKRLAGVVGLADELAAEIADRNAGATVRESMKRQTGYLAPEPKKYEPVDLSKHPLERFDGADVATYVRSKNDKSWEVLVPEGKQDENWNNLVRAASRYVENQREDLHPLSERDKDIIRLIGMFARKGGMMQLESVQLAAKCLSEKDNDNPYGRVRDGAEFIVGLLQEGKVGQSNPQEINGLAYRLGMRMEKALKYDSNQTDSASFKEIELPLPQVSKKRVS